MAETHELGPSAREPARPLRGRLLSAGLIGAALTVTAAVRADDASEFELAKTAFDRADYEGAAKRYAYLLDPSNPPCAAVGSGNCRLTDPEFIERARVVYAISLIALKKGPEADAQILNIYLDNPGYAPNPADPPEVIERFTNVYTLNRAKIQAAAAKRAEDARQARLREKALREKEVARIALLEHLASQERVVDTNSRLVALVPFGVGQFQNGDVGLGLGFGISQLVAGGFSIVSGVVASDLSQTNPYETPLQDEAEFDRIDGWVLANRISFAVWAASTVIGVVHAQISFVPERTTIRPRPIPKPAAPADVAPTVSVLPGGGKVGLVGRF